MENKTPQIINFSHLIKITLSIVFNHSIQRGSVILWHILDALEKFIYKSFVKAPTISDARHEAPTTENLAQYNINIKLQTII